ncbi:Myo-inositol-1-phosphate synthase [Ramaria rubella]|nr:Myo-inositol-1-phosphate synthase [Ramaria rubella]
MAPVATNPVYTPTSGFNTPESQLDGPVHSPPIHPTAARRPYSIVVNSKNTTYSDNFITAKYENRGANVVTSADGQVNIVPTVKSYEFRTARNVQKTGLMMVGMGGNNGTTLSATILANRHNISWGTKSGLQAPNYIGSLLRASTIRLGSDPATGKDVHVPISDVLPMVHPNDLVLGGWDISSLSMDKAMARAQVLDWDLQRQVAPLMALLGKPLPSVYYPSFIAANQSDRADNLIPGQDKQVHLEQIRADIRNFKAQNELDRVIVFWTANTERFSDILADVNDNSDNLLDAIKSSHEEVSPSTLFAVAAILENAPFINGAPQNTFVPGVIDLAEKHHSFIGGDDLKSGQTKLKSVLAEFLVNAGIKPLSIASYNHLGNNDGRNLSSAAQFKSKEISKSSVVDDMVESNRLLYKTAEQLAASNKNTSTPGNPVKPANTKGEHPDHVVVIKYVPAVGDSKRAIDEYYSEILMGGRSTINIFNECEDSLLATPLILDLTILTELLTRVQYRELSGASASEFSPLYSVLSLLSYMLKAPLVKPGTDVVNSLSRQRNGLEQFLKACIGLDAHGDILLDTRLW